MDLLWLFIIIFGAVVSLGQKSQKKAPEAEVNMPESIDPEAEFERQIRELLGETRPSAKPAESATPNNTTTQKQTAREASKSARRERVESVQNGTNYQTAIGNHKTLSTPAAKSKIKSNEAASKTNNQKQESSEVEQMIDDFSIEKAVIYAEILKPKYEEF